MPGSIAEAFQNLRTGDIEAVVARELDEGKDPYVLLRECQEGMAGIGRRFEEGRYYLAELILSARMFQQAMRVLSPRLEGGGAGGPRLGKIVLGTPKGDIHDLGKTIFGLLAAASGFEVVDLGVDVPPERFLDKVGREGAEIVGMSGLVTTVYPSMRAVVELLQREGLRERVKVIIGGGAAGEECRRHVGADATTHDAAEGVRICRDFLAAGGPGS